MGLIIYSLDQNLCSFFRKLPVQKILYTNKEFFKYHGLLILVSQVAADAPHIMAVYREDCDIDQEYKPFW